MGLQWLQLFQAMFGGFKSGLLPTWASVSSQFVLIENDGSVFADRDWSGAAIMAFELDFKGYERIPVGSVDEWDVWSITEPYTESAAKTVAWVYNSSLSGSDTRTVGNYVAWVVNDGSNDRVLAVWEVPSPVDFDSDGKTGSYELRLRYLNAEDVV